MTLQCDGAHCVHPNISKQLFFAAVSIYILYESASLCEPDMISQKWISRKIIAASLITRDTSVSETKFPKTFINQIKFIIQLKTFTHKIEKEGTDVLY